MSRELTDGERWFVDRGLPWFVDDVRAQVSRALRPARLLLLVVVALLIGAAFTATAVMIGDGEVVDDLAWGIAAGGQLALVVVAVYALFALKGLDIARWAARRTLGSLGLLFPLVTRALPLLLLFVTFLFINAEVWQVSATLDGAVMSWTILLFSAVAVGFLLVRLPEEMEIFDRDLDPDRVVTGCRGTPFEQAATSYSDADTARRVIDERISGLQKINLTLVLLIAQAVQVLLLSLSVFVFFVVFGMLIMQPDVVAAWVGEKPHDLFGLGVPRLSRELLQVSVFLAAFSGLYFTVYAVTDELYRKQFFTAITDELELAVTARAAYRVAQTAH